METKHWSGHGRECIRSGKLELNFLSLSSLSVLAPRGDHFLGPNSASENESSTLPVAFCFVGPVFLTAIGLDL